MSQQDNLTNKCKMRICIVFLLLAFTNIIQAQTGFLIEGKLNNAAGLKIYLVKGVGAMTSNQEDVLIDSFLIVDTTFKLQGYVEEPSYYSISIQNKEGYIPFILENKNYQILGNAEFIWEFKIEGSEEVELEKEHGKLVNPWIELLNAAADSSSIMEERQDTIRSRMYNEQNQFYYKQMRIASKDFIVKHPDAYVSLFLFPDLQDSYDKKERIEIFESLSSRLKQHSYAKMLRYELYEIDAVITVGKKTASFSLQDMFSDSISLEDYKDKYVLIDFWASWCEPCRAEHPFLIEMYKQYEPLNFDIISVSIDKNIDNWKRAIKEDKLMWNNVLDLKDGESIVAPKYGVKAIPTNFLLNGDGVLIAKDLHGENLSEKLREIFN